MKLGLFNDTPEPSLTLWGIGTTRSRPKQSGGESVFYIGLDRKRGVFDQDAGRETRHTLGFRAFGQFPTLDYNFDAFLQLGSFKTSAGADNIRAWAVSADIGYVVNHTNFKLRLGVRGDVTSGDPNPKDNVLHTFNPLLPGTTYSDTIGLIGASNSIAVFPNLRLLPKKNITITFGPAFFWRHSTRDGIYSINVSPLRTGQLSKSRFVGAQPSFRFDWSIQRHWSCTAILSAFETGNFLKETPPGKSTSYVTSWLTFRF